ncbi:MAG: HNH endonuclease domain-containing protein [Bacteroidales bacterium]|nr:HNH endonuclease domain-containing protein [Bacteroidales bacterium]
MGKILGLDLGTNSIGWAVVDTERKEIVGAGSRIIPLDGEITSNYEKGNASSQTGDRTMKRLARRTMQRFQLRRERLLRVLRVMGFLPEHYAGQLNRYGQFLDHGEPKLAWREGKDGKMEFLFQASFGEMLRDFEKRQPAILAEGRKVPYDWTIYYLRHKAINQPIAKEELAWVLLQLNQKRGYYKLRGKDEQEQESKKKDIKKDIVRQRVTSVTEDTETKGKKKRFRIVLGNGMEFYNWALRKPEWEGMEKDFVVTTSLDKDGNVERSFRVPNDDDWTLLKLKTEEAIKENKTTVGDYIYSALLDNPDQKIVGQLVRTVDRCYYLDEARAILNKQAEFIPELRNRELYGKCITELYGVNDPYRHNIEQRDFTYLLVDDTLFYQRPLKSKKSLVSDCPYEARCYVDKETGEVMKQPLKCASKSHPLFQEFRLWQFVGNLKIYKMDAKGFSKDVTPQLLPDGEACPTLFSGHGDKGKARADLFDWLNDKDSINQKTLLQYPGFNIPKEERDKYRWNYVEDKSYPVNATRADMLKALKEAGVDANFLTQEKEVEMWHMLYSISDAKEMEKAAEKYAYRNGMKNAGAFAERFCRIKPYDADYAAYSLKAIKKLLPLMRMGQHWNEQDVDTSTKERIRGLIDGTLQEQAIDRIRQRDKDGDKDRNAHFEYRALQDCQGLPVWEACYVAYGRHSEGTDVQCWESPDDIDAYLTKFRHHSLRNPIVEQVAMETLRTVRDIWRQFGRPDEIHLEMAREMKQTAEERKRATDRNTQNERTNMRIKQLLSMLADNECDMENVLPYSPSQQEKLKIYEQGAIDAGGPPENDVKEVFNLLSSPLQDNTPSRSEVLKYKQWLEQRYLSPYTGQVIPLSRLFTEDYQIEHVIPQARYFDDSMLNKVVCEAAVNAKKGSLTAHEFIMQCHGEVVELPGGRTVTILGVQEYEEQMRKNYHDRNRAKWERMMLDDVPETFINRQLNDSRYISRFLMSVLSNVVREKDKDGNAEPDAISKNLITVTGAVTDRLKRDWHLNDQWNTIILPRFERLDAMANEGKAPIAGLRFVALSREGHKIPQKPTPQLNFSSKRIDHRHHALDAIVIACATREHVNLLSNEAALPKNHANRLSLSFKLREQEEWTNKGKPNKKFGSFKLPWPNMPMDTLQALQGIAVSFKKDVRVLTLTKNRCRHLEKDAKGNLRSSMVLQEGRNLAIRKALHKDTVFGEVRLRLKKDVNLKEALSNPNIILVDKELRQKVKELRAEGKGEKDMLAYFKKNSDVWPEAADGKVEVYYRTEDTTDRYFASRYGNSLVNLFAMKKTEKEAEKVIKSITDTGIQKILLAHLHAEGNDPQKAFCAEGVERMNANIVALNGGRQHKPIRTVRCYEKANKFAVGNAGNKKKKFVEAAKGTYLFYLVCSMPGKSREGVPLPLCTVVDLQKKHGGKWHEHLLEDLSSESCAILPQETKVLFILSPNDLVYCPSKEEREQGVKEIDKSRIYKIVSCSDKSLYGVPAYVAKAIEDKVEFESQNKMTKTLEGETIRDICLPLNVDRLGNVVLAPVKQ